MLSYNPVHKRYTGDHNMRSVTKVVRKHQSVRVGAVTEKDFSVANKKKLICKYITAFCFHAEKLGFVNTPLKFV